MCFNQEIGNAFISVKKGCSHSEASPYNDETESVYIAREVCMDHRKYSVKNLYSPSATPDTKTDRFYPMLMCSGNAMVKAMILSQKELSYYS